MTGLTLRRTLFGLTAAVMLGGAPLLYAQADRGDGAGGAASVAPAPPLAPAPPQSLDGAPIALMYDLGSSRTLLARETDRRFIPASLTKLMTAYTAFEMVEEGRIALDQVITVDPETARQWSRRGSSMFVRAGDRITIDTLLAGIVTVSANDGCVVLAKGVSGSVDAFTREMNAEARKLRMTDSHFNTPNGWPDEGRTYTSARDLAKLAKAILTDHPDLYRRYFAMEEFSFNDITQKHHNPILGAVAGADGLKTGFTNEAGYGFVGSAQRDGRRLIMVVGNTETSRERKQISRDFMEWGFGEWSATRLFGKDAEIGRVKVQGGSHTSVAVAASRPVFVTTPIGKAPNPSVSIVYQGPVVAPIRKGERIAELHVENGNGKASRMDLVAMEDVAPANRWQKLRNGLLGLVD